MLLTVASVLTPWTKHCPTKAMPSPTTSGWSGLSLCHPMAGDDAPPEEELSPRHEDERGYPPSFL